MKLTVDTNCLIAALIKDGAARSILRNQKYEFFTPDFALDEIWRHRNDIEKKAELNEEEFIIFLFLLFHKVIPISSERYKKHMIDALDIIGHVDPDDAPFIACALELNVPV